jgi:hypothetical protein
VNWNSNQFLAGRRDRSLTLEFTDSLATAMGIEAPDIPWLEFKSRLVGRRGRKGCLEFTSTLATAMEMGAPDSDGLEFTCRVVGRCGRIATLEFRHEMATAFLIMPHPFVRWQACSTRSIDL